MHLSEGVLSAPVLAAGAILTAGGVAVGLKKMDLDEVPKVAMLSSAFFVASLIHVPVGPTSVHLVLNGVVGLLLGWVAFPSILVGLTLQAVLFQFGGFTTLGVNTFNMAFPALVCSLAFSPLVRARSRMLALVGGAACGALGIFLGAILIGISLVFTGESFLKVAQLTIVAHIPVMIIEGILTAFCVVFLRKVHPELLGVSHEMR
ncbi:MAG: cobalt transporter CbiM [Candidatus Latescibacterota bacterium]